MLKITRTVTAHVSSRAWTAYDKYPLLLRRSGIYLTKHEIFERIMLGLSRRRIKSMLDDAILELSDAELEPSMDKSVIYYISWDAGLDFDELVHRMKVRRARIKYNKQVVQGMCLALERSDVRDYLLPLMQNDQP